MEFMPEPEDEEDGPARPHKGRTNSQIEMSDHQRHVPRSPITGKPYGRDAGNVFTDDEEFPDNER